ncbi:nucleotide-binding domain-containing protein [Klebsiella pneumoniae]|uniref:Guanylate cyclase n=1 Tax=Escherichia coli TaxID=562 RepID=A0A8T6BIH7_ECOLX|nr:adenylate/guanylate cyclase domain-containing protein [Klebsiella pneumoniae]MED8166509.1 adenylate/guanylate cyclase domain-containing protein [Escherichia coli]MCJ8613347.1 guanylate cyclase [Klebsiella pneumoniae]MXG80289.1 guanylate cyclase [Escherichia coli]MXJ10110.1 guanylate cyclase [Escherichia coli]NGX73893.1 guanylate cyclase [Klebsiella pneumoniae]
MSFKEVTAKNFKGLRSVTLKKKMAMDGYLRVGTEARLGDELSESFSTSPSNFIEYDYQKEVRPFFQKLGLNEHSIGTHPELTGLNGVGAIHSQYIVTMFIDIRKSSRLSLLLPLEQAYVVKNRILQACIDIVRALDGYPHRLMGDALMAFFGRSDISKEDAIADAINAASTLRLILMDYIFPSLNEDIGEKIDLGVRIGLDYGSEEEVIWGNFGLGESCEVTALGLPVDMTAKLQQLADKNTAMLGQGILDYIDFPEEYTKPKIKAGEELKYIIPNITNKEGKPINRRIRLLNMANYQDLLPFKLNDKKMASAVLHPNHFTFECFVVEDDREVLYSSVSRFLPKERSLKFKLKIYPGLGKLNIIFCKRNHGQEAKDDLSEDYSIRIVDDELVKVKNASHLSLLKESECLEVSLPEGTSFRGLHTMEVIVKGENDTLYYRNIIGVYIK